ncbi:MAG: HAMP domain-containing sensor histidine kinase, partial [Verrucomicrobiota bacterium]
MRRTIPASPEIQKAFQEWDQAATINNFKIACYLGLVLMPAGVVLDHFVYPNQVAEFLKLRLLADVLIAGFLLLLPTPFARKHYRTLGVALAMLPSTFISLMIYETGNGASSPYYAGLNLVLLVVGFVMHWTFRESLIAVSLVIIVYVTACLASGPVEDFGIFFNNIYFLVLTGIIVVTGRFFHSQLRFREFALRYELDKNKHELEEKNRKLIELDQLKSRFFANVSHELRTPLTLLLSPLEALMQRFDRSFDPGGRDMLATMHANGMRLLKLINDLLDLIRLEAGRMAVNPEPLLVEDFLKGLASAVRQVSENKRIQLETIVDEQLGAVMLDKDKLEKVVLNLLFNALKFTPVDGRVWLRAEKRDNDLVLIVSDTGVGIAEKNLMFVFDRFWQEDGSSKRKFQGVGIGLALVKELVDMMGGSVTVQSQEGKGATFTVRLPYQKAEVLPKTETPAPAPAENGVEA